jgi:ATP-binding cassette subfamily C protein CydC
MNELWRLFKLLKPYSGWLLLGIVLSAITLLANISLMAISGWFIASMAIAGVAGASINYFSPAAMIRAAAIFRTAGRYAERLVTHEATFRLLSGLRVWFYRHLEPLVPAALEDMRSGDLLSRIGGDIDMLDNFYIRVIVPAASAVLVVALSTWVISLYHATLALVLLGFLLLSGLLLPLLIAWLGKKPGHVVVDQSAALRSQVVDNVQGMAELTVYGALQDSTRRLRESSEQCLQAQLRMGRISGLSQSGLLLFSQLAVWFVMLLAVPMVTASIIQPAELPMLALFVLAAFESVMPLPEAFRLLGQVRLAAVRLFALIDRQPVVSEPVQDIPKPDSFDLSFNQVSLRYSEQADAAVRDLDLNLAAGARLAVVGPTGSGKSSLIQLLLHYRDPHSGTIHLGGHPLSDYRSEQLHQWISVVPQQVHLFNTTIRNNLLVARPDASEAQIERACQQAKIDEFIRQQPEAYETWVGETGIKLSGGQARRLAIARALLRDFDCLVLDEPGEGLDTRTERELLKDLIPELGGKTFILITHRLTGLELMDRIMVLDDGACLEQGSYSDLIKQGYLARYAVVQQ